MSPTACSSWSAHTTDTIQLESDNFIQYHGTMILIFVASFYLRISIIAMTFISNRALQHCFTSTRGNTSTRIILYIISQCLFVCAFACTVLDKKKQ